MDSTVITDAISKQEWLEPVAQGMQGAVSGAYAAGGETGKKVENFLNGVWLGHPLHPAVVYVPLGAWTASSVLDVMEAGGNEAVGPGADAAVAVGLVGALASAVTGLTQWHPLEARSTRRVGATHALLNVTATGLFAASLVVRKRGNRPLGRALGWLGCAIVSGSAYLGGSLAYEQKIGVDHAPRENLPRDFVPVLPEAELAENQMKRVDAGGIPVLLARRNGRVFALAESCAHLGGPLSEGALEDGCVRCPWHGSKFRLEDGQVVDGPSTYPQPRFETRVQGGQIEVRAPEIPQNGE